MTAICGGLWVYTCLDHRQETDATEAVTRRVEAQKPFLSKQLDVYFETSQVTGRLSTLQIGDSDWASNELRFLELYWSRLSLVADDRVSSAMQQLQRAMTAYKTCYAAGQRDPTILAGASSITRSGTFLKI